jgi:hypothetical protein
MILHLTGKKPMDCDTENRNPVDPLRKKIYNYSDQEEIFSRLCIISGTVPPENKWMDRISPDDNLRPDLVAGREVHRPDTG